MKGRKNYPLLFDRLGQPKPALDAVIDTNALEQRGQNGKQ
jgi:GH35 family endo-1,4-beta-xylanase